MVKFVEEEEIKGNYYIDIKNDPDLKDIPTTLECGVKSVSAKDIIKRLNDFEEIKKVFPKYGVSFFPLADPYLIKEIDDVAFSQRGSNYKEYIYPKKGSNKKVNVLYCHGQNGMERAKPIDNWMLRTDASPELRDIPIPEIVRGILAEGEKIDVLGICNAGGYPKNAKDYPFLEDILYGKGWMSSQIYFKADGTSHSSLYPYDSIDGKLFVPKSWANLIEVNIPKYKLP